LRRLMTDSVEWYKNTFCKDCPRKARCDDMGLILCGLQKISNIEKENVREKRQ